MIRGTARGKLKSASGGLINKRPDPDATFTLVGVSVSSEHDRRITEPSHDSFHSSVARFRWPVAAARSRFLNDFDTQLLNHTGDEISQDLEISQPRADQTRQSALTLNTARSTGDVRPSSPKLWDPRPPRPRDSVDMPTTAWLSASAEQSTANRLTVAENEDPVERLRRWIDREEVSPQLDWAAGSSRTWDRSDDVSHGAGEAWGTEASGRCSRWQALFSRDALRRSLSTADSLIADEGPPDVTRHTLLSRFPPPRPWAQLAPPLTPLESLAPIRTPQSTWCGHEGPPLQSRSNICTLRIMCRSVAWNQNRLPVKHSPRVSGPCDRCCAHDAGSGHLGQG